MKTLVKTNEFGKVSKSFFSNEDKAMNAAVFFIRDCLLHRSIEIIDFEFEKYGFSRMPMFANWKGLESGGFLVTGVFESFQGGFFTTSYEVSNL